MATTVSSNSDIISSIGMNLGTSVSGSSLDLSSLISKLQTVEEQRLTPYNNKQTSLSKQATAYTTVESAMKNLQSATTTLQNMKTITSTAVTSTNTAFSATTDSTAVAGSYSVFVNNIAQAQSQISGNFSSASTALVSGGTSSTSSTITITQSSQSTPLTITLTDDKTSLNDIRDAINNAGGSVSATILNDGTNNKLILTAKDTGTKSAMSISVSGSLSSSLGSFTEQVAAKDASFTINGVSVTSQSNTVTTAISGVTLNLKAASTTGSNAESLTIASDITNTEKAVQNWVTAYNNVLDVIKTQTNYTAPTSTEQSDGTQSSSNGALVSDSTIRAIKRQLQGLMSNFQGSGSLNTMADLGITQDPTNDGKLTVDNTKLESTLKSSSSSVAQFFVGNGTTTGFATQAGNYLTRTVDSADGLIKSAQASIKTSQASVTKQLASIQDSIDSTMARYKTQFTNLNTLLSKLSSTSSYLTQQFNKTSSSS
ncbi:flagellar filament capping protein FliD [Dickeya dadantii]|uniref:Flagellar hook-associated protein 2 n=3 Tax=Dickeya TaxID=204037 RepID=E0SHV1_DICD3|nr:Flagellar hook-associated protein fliD [Dickeya dadantii 3937]MCL6404836.1 flagellar filament capping protein FliD [Dickeya dadantii]CAD22871.1 flagellar hook associated protein 2 [Dickeya chrysanthemi]NPE56150.1 flagellar filament capping protein FliD [Dickeya dadantii]NPE67724.1 flagellar filament capping protein FliD [Dickeya dadantii]